MSKILVTGAGGAVGRQIIKYFGARNSIGEYQSDEVKATDLPGNWVNNIDYSDGIETVTMELAKAGPMGIQSLTENVDQIIHTAAIVDISTPWDKLKTINVEVTARLARQAFEQGAFFTFISSGSIYKSRDSIITENAALEPTSPYERSKVEAENEIHRIARQYNGKYAILRPALIYGPGCKFLGAALAAIPPLVKLVSKNEAIGFTGGPKTNWVHCRDVACAAIFISERKKEGTFNVADDTRFGFGEAITLHLKAYGLKVKRTIPLPTPAMLRLGRPLLSNEHVWSLANKPIGLVWSLFARSKNLEKGLDVQINKEMAPYLFNDTIFANDRIKNAGFSFWYKNIGMGVDETMRWYKGNHWIC